MSNIKNGFQREIIIDRCLKNRRGYSTQEIMDKVNDALESRGEKTINALNTIRNDILSIENRWHIVVEQIRSGREIKYRYEDPDFSIYNSPLTEDDIMQLSESISILRRFKGFPGFEWLEELNVRLQSSINAKSKPFIGFDDNERLKGIEHFSDLFNAINEQKTIKVGYKPHKGDIKEEIVHPYYLKQYNQRWFLFGLNHLRGEISIYALDRIQYILESNIKYKQNESNDFDQYFKDIIGVSKYKGEEPVEIQLLVFADQLPYNLTKPIHTTQKVIQKNEDGSAVLSIKVVPNFELIQLLLSFGERITVLSPEYLREEIKQRIEKNLNNYK